MAEINRREDYDDSDVQEQNERLSRQRSDKRDRNGEKVYVDIDAFEDEIQTVTWTPLGRPDLVYSVDVNINSLSADDLRTYDREVKEIRYDIERLAALKRKKANMNGDEENYAEVEAEIAELEDGDDEIDVGIERIWMPAVVDHNITRGGIKIDLSHEGIRTLPLKMFNGLTGKIVKALTEDAHPKQARRQKKRSSRGSRTRR